MGSVAGGRAGWPFTGAGYRGDAYDTWDNKNPHSICKICPVAPDERSLDPTDNMAVPTTPESPTEIFTKLFAESRQSLHRYIRRFVGSSETAKEIVQEAFLRTYRQRESVTTLRAFLFSTARNLAANEYRHRRIMERGEVGDLGDSVVKSESLEAQLLKDERNRLIQEAIDRLPPQCRAAFTLRVFHECSYKEVADRLGISAKTVEKHIARGLHDTHNYLKRRYDATRRGHG
jgi:RNA polymerase sigma-70 factor (ECF subfamily)